MLNKFIKKAFTIFLITITFSCTMMLGCNGNQGTIKIYAPDGAPALALASAMDKNFKNVEYNIIDNAMASNMHTFVTGKNSLADICILPINVAVNNIGDGSSYKMLGTITHGNFYFLSTENVEIKKDNLSCLLGKSIGVLQLNNVPGQTLKMILQENSVPYVINSSASSQGVVNLVGITKSEVIVQNYDYFLLPSPLADNKAKATELNIVGSLQGLYSEQGFPQAVVVCKNELISNNLNFVKEFVLALKGVNDFLVQENIEKVCSLIASNLPSDTNATFTKNNLTVDIIKNSSIKFISSKNCKQQVVDFVSRLNATTSDGKNLLENFFYLGDI